jgi:rRNA-processing protein FCF1
MTVALDASALMAPVEADLRLFEELDRIAPGQTAVVPEAVRRELDGLAAGAGEAATAAAVARDLASGLETVEHEASHADDALVDLAARGAVDAVVTNDGPLRGRLLDRGVPVIHLRGRTQLQRSTP